MTYTEDMLEDLQIKEAAAHAGRRLKDVFANVSNNEAASAPGYGERRAQVLQSLEGLPLSDVEKERRVQLLMGEAHQQTELFN